MKKVNLTRSFLLGCCALAGVVLAGTACKSSKPDSGSPATPAALPEVSLRAKTANEVKVVAGKFFLDRGYVETHTQYLYEMVFDKPTKGGHRALRIRLNLHKQPDDVWRLTGTPLGVDGWRSDLESETVLLLEGASQVQGFLVEIKNRVESR